MNHGRDGREGAADPPQDARLDQRLSVGPCEQESGCECGP